VWEFISAMRHKHHGWNHVYKAYCEAHNLPLGGGPQWADAVPGAPSVRPAHEREVARDRALDREETLPLGESTARCKVKAPQLREGGAPTPREVSSAEDARGAAAPAVIRHSTRVPSAAPSGSQSGDAPPATAKGSEGAHSQVRRSGRR